MKTKIEELKEFIQNDYVTEEQASCIIDLLEQKFCSKDAMLKFAGYSPEQLRKVDSAYPQEIQNQVIEIIGGENCPNFAYDYNKHTFGSVINVDRLFLSKLKTIFRNF